MRMTIRPTPWRQLLTLRILQPLCLTSLHRETSLGSESTTKFGCCERNPASFFKGCFPRENGCLNPVISGGFGDQSMVTPALRLRADGKRDLGSLAVDDSVDGLIAFPDSFLYCYSVVMRLEPALFSPRRRTISVDSSQWTVGPSFSVASAASNSFNSASKFSPPPISSFPATQRPSRLRSMYWGTPR